MNKPKILLMKPEGKLVLKSFHKKKIQLWEGYAYIEDIHGWVNNPRIDIELKKFRDSHTGRDPSGAEIFSIMKHIKEFRLKELASDVRDNGIRQPIIVTNDGKLLDGNRRFYSTKLILEDLDPAERKKSEFRKIPVWVLHEDCTEEDEELILVQENFYPSRKVEWSDYVKAQHIYGELQDGIPLKSVAQKYAWTSSKVTETKRIMELIDEFQRVATSEISQEDEYSGFGMAEVEAERVSAEKYHFFNEAQKSFRTRLERDFDFKMNFFKMVLDGKFSSFAEVRVMSKAWDLPKAKKVLLSDDPKAAKKAKAVVDYEGSIEAEEESIEEIIDGFIEFLGGLTTDQKAKLLSKPDHLGKLKQSLSVVIEMSESAKS